MEQVFRGGTSPLVHDFGDGVHVPLVKLWSDAAPESGDRELLSTTYTVKQAWAGAVEGEVIRQTVALDVSGATMTVISVLWENESTGVTISAPPNVSAYLEPVKQGDSLTLAQLLSAGLSTASNQVTQIGYLADLADANDRFGNYKLVQSEDLGDGVKYILKSDGTGWLMVKKTYTNTASALSYAGPASNASVTLAQAWGLRASLSYGSISGV